MTSPGFIGGSNRRKKFGFPGSGPALVITDFGVYGFTKGGEEMVLWEIHPGITVADVKANIGWDVKVSRKLGETNAPATDELRIIREDLDPNRIHLRDQTNRKLDKNRGLRGLY